jgi:putative oxidoreductase
MVVAILTAQLGQVHGVADLFGLVEFAYLAVLVWLAVAGPGALSVDHAIARRRRASLATMSEAVA